MPMEKVTDSPTKRFVERGCEVIIGEAVTVRVATELVMEP